MSAKFKVGERVKIHTPHDLAYHGKTGTVSEGDPPEPASDYGYDAWVVLDEVTAWTLGPSGFTNDELRPIGGQR